MTKQLSIFDQVDVNKAAIEDFLQMDIEDYRIQRGTETHFIAYALTNDSVYDVVINLAMGGQGSAVVTKYSRQRVWKVLPKIFKGIRGWEGMKI